MCFSLRLGVPITGARDLAGLDGAGKRIRETMPPLVRACSRRVPHAVLEDYIDTSSLVARPQGNGDTQHTVAELQEEDVDDNLDEGSASIAGNSFPLQALDVARPEEAHTSARRASI